MTDFLRQRDLAAGRRLRWYVVTGRTRGTCHTLGRYLASSRFAAVNRCLRQKADLVAGLQLSAEVSR